MPQHKSQEPWLPAEPGDLIEASDWNEVQQFARSGIVAAEAKCDAAVEELRNSLDDIDAAKFDGKTPQEWAQQFAPAVHDHEGQSVYRRFIKRFERDYPEAFLDHGLGRYPLVDVFELLPVVGDDPRAQVDDRLRACKLLFYYGHVDADRYDLRVSIGRDRRYLGIPFEQALAELGVDYDDNDTIEDVLSDLWTVLSRDPNDELDHCTTPWVDECCGERRTVQDLKDADQWADLRLGIRPARCPLVPVCITQVDYDTVHVAADQRMWRRPLEFYRRVRTIPLDPWSDQEAFQREYPGVGLDPRDPLKNLEVPGGLDLMFLLRS
jgi:hypothetical protein